MNPYATLPQRQYWSRAVSRRYDPATIGTFDRPLIGRDDRVVTAGSCFAANLVPYLEGHGLTYLRTEPRHPIFANLPPDNFSYDKFSAAFGNVYTVRQLLQLLRRCTGTFTPVEDRWHIDGEVIDPFRPGLRYPARSDREYDLLTAQHLAATREAFARCTVLIFTLGLTEACLHCSAILRWKAAYRLVRIARHTLRTLWQDRIRLMSCTPINRRSMSRVPRFLRHSR